VEYPKEFENLLITTKENLIGWGNPNAKILVVGKESAIAKGKNSKADEQYEKEIIGNRDLWRKEELRVSQDDIVPYIFNESGSEILNYEKITYNPLYPYKGQQFCVRRVKGKGENKIIIGKKGTSLTWYNYQRLCDLIREQSIIKNKVNDFHKYFFTTELSDEAGMTSSDPNPDKRKQSIDNRKLFFKNDFFKSFPIIILAAGNYPERFGVNYDSFWGPTPDVETIISPCKGIYKIVYAKGERRKMFIQTYQLSMVSENLIKMIANYCKSFRFENNIII
jgi:hypothetical protein